MTPQTFLLFGPSGSGKGTQAALLMESLKEKDPERKILYLETGARLREFAKEDSYTAKKTREVIDAGGLMPEFVPIYVWSSFFIHEFTGNEHVVLDGISRRPHEALIIDSLMQFYGIKDPVVISIKVSPEWATERLVERGRVDDKEAEIKSRMEWYEKNVVQALKHFQGNPYYKFVEINGEQTIEEVHQEILEKIGFK